MPVKKLEKPTKRARENFPESVPVKLKMMPVKKNTKYAHKTSVARLLNMVYVL